MDLQGIIRPIRLAEEFRFVHKPRTHTHSLPFGKLFSLEKASPFACFCPKMSTFTELSQQTTAKLVLLGEMGSGKSSLVLRYVKGQFFDYQVR